MMKKICYANEENNTITFDKDFFEALYIEKSQGLGKELSSLSLRLASLLLQELNEIEYKKLPKRTYLAEKLNVSRTSIVASLYQLEVAGFLSRLVKDKEWHQMMIMADEVEQLKKNQYYTNKIIERRENKDFSDLFIINSNYNNCINKNMEGFILETLGFNKNINIDKISEIERRLDIIEQKLNIK